MSRISIHAPARGATHGPTTGTAHPWYFNSRPCERGDAESGGSSQNWSQFQFTPLREGRLFRQDSAGITGKFQFTPLREGRPHRRAMQVRTHYFNSRPCERGDLSSKVLGYMFSYFNSRPCERGDLRRNAKQRQRQRISIHAPARGATCCPIHPNFIFWISIHAPARGATAIFPC